MASYNEIDGVPSHANRWLLRDVLRDEWGFDGFVVSDYYAICELAERPETHGHHVAARQAEACVLAVRAGVNIELPEPDCYLHLVELVREGTLAEARARRAGRADAALRSSSWACSTIRTSIRRSGAHRRLRRASRSWRCRRRARRSRCSRTTATCCRSTFGALKTIAVIGPNADRSLLGGYSGGPKHDVTVLEGIREPVGDRAKVALQRRLQDHASAVRGTQDEVIASDPDEDRRRSPRRSKVAKRADVIVLAIGGNEQTSREAWTCKHMGDRTSLDLVGRQNELVDAMVAHGKADRRGAVQRAAAVDSCISTENVPAILECWYLGQETGQRRGRGAVRRRTTPAASCRSPIPRSVGHLPAFYNYKPSARRGYLFDDVSPLYPFGFGLSYTTFALSNVRLDEAAIRRRRIDDRAAST